MGHGTLTLTEAYEKFDDPWCYVPEHIRDGIQEWIERAVPTGSFLQSIISNDLNMAVGKADHININHIPQIVRWFFNYAPAECWGRPEALENWQGLKKRKVANDI